MKYKSLISLFDGDLPIGTIFTYDEGEESYVPSNTEFNTNPTYFLPTEILNVSSLFEVI